MDAGIYNLNIDIDLLESFARRCDVPNLQETFAELRQICDLILSGDAPKFNNEQLRASRYPYLNAGKMTKLFDKYRDLGMFSFAKLPANVVQVKRSDIQAMLKLLQQ
jgi:hypothetical protein